MDTSNSCHYQVPITVCNPYVNYTDKVEDISNNK